MRAHFYLVLLEMDEEEKELIDRAEKEFMKAIETGKTTAVQEPEVLLNGVEEETTV